MKRLLLFSAILFPGVAFAADGLTTGALTLDSTFETISVICAWTGDDNGDATGAVRFRTPAGSGAWKTAYAPYCDRRTNPFQRTGRIAIQGLTADTTYEVEFTFTDADGVNGTNPRTGTIATPSLTPPTGGRIVNVANDASLTSALSSHQAGDDIVLASGIYSSRTISVSGNAGAWTRIRSAVPGGATLSAPITVNGSYLILEDLTIARGPASSIVLGSGSSRYIKNCTFPDVSTGASYGNAGVYVARVAARTWIKGCSFHTSNPSTGGDYGVLFAVYFESGGGNIAGADFIGDVIISGPFRDGIGGEGNNLGAFARVGSTFARITVTGGQDDSIECEGSLVNFSCYGMNITKNSGNDAFGNGGTNIGPAFFHHNLIRGTGGVIMVKLGNTSPGPAYWFNNTIAGTGAGQADGFSDVGGPTLSDHNIYRNNLIQSARYPYYRGGRANSYDYDYFVTGFGAVADEYNGSGTHYALADFQSATGQESHGLSGASPFVSSTDLTLKAGTSAVDRGLTLSNFNDADSAWPAQGAGPDIGAFESGGAGPVDLPTAPSNLSAIIVEP